MPLIGRIASAAARGYGLFANIVQAAVDPYFNYVVALLHGDGTNGGQNNTFLDSSSNNFTITRNGNTTQGSFSPFSQTGWGNYFDGTGDYLTAGSSISLSSSFTIEGWVYISSTAATSYLFGLGDDSTSTGLCIFISTTGQPRMLANNSYLVSGSAGQVPANQWVHIALVRNSTSLTLYVNGTSVGTGTSSATYSGTAYVGAENYASTIYSTAAEYLSNVRVTTSAVYTANFTVPTTPLTAISGTSLLTCQSNRFLDASTNNFTITRNGDVSVQPLSPFNPTTAYSTSSIGGSGYFDGSGDYLNVGSGTNNIALSGDFCIEAWIYRSSNADGTIIGNYNSSPNRGWSFRTYSSTNLYLYFQIDGGAETIYQTSAGSAPINQWMHLVWCRSGTNTSVFINGVRADNRTLSGTSTGNGGLSVSALSQSRGDINFNGYISSARVVTGSSVYDPSQTTITVPTSPLIAVSGTQALLSFTNGAIFDNAAVADYETVGNAQISTSVKKYGTGSLAFDGTGDWLVAPASTSWDFGSGDFTVELWVNPSVITAPEALVSKGNASSVGNEVWTLQWYGTNQLAFFSGGGLGTPVVTTGSVFATGNWYHVAVCRTAGVTKIFVNGTEQGTSTTSYTITAGGALYVGAGWYAPASRDISGYIDDLRITKGIARYPYSFTPPTAALPDIGGTITLTADPYYEYTTLLLPGNGTNGAQNNTFLDSSTNAFTITRNGNTTQGTFSPFSQTGWGAYFDGSGDYCTLSSNASMDFGAGNFTIECWVYTGVFSISAGASRTIIGNSGNSYTMQLYIETGSGKVVFGNTGSTNLQGTNTVADNQWHHIVVVRSGTGSNQTALFVDGNRQAVGTNSQNYSSGTIYLGSFDTGNGFWNGYISNLRIVKGTAVYDPTQVTLTVPTSPLTAVSNTALLTFQSNRFLDNSTNAYTVTRVGDTSIQAFSPFNPTASWSAATYGGSGYFDGSGDYLTVAATSSLAFGSGDYTIEGWFYVTGTSDYFVFDMRTASGIYAYVEGSTGNNFVVATSGIAQSNAGTYRVNAWNHFAFVRSGSGSNNTSIYLNGTRTLQGTDTTNYSSNTGMYVGARYTATVPFVGYISDFRCVKGTAVYSGATYTVPTAPLTAITNTSLLLNYTNAGIYDATSKNDLETVGNAQISTTQSKFGGSSMYFDGTGDYLKLIGPAAPSQYIGFGTGDFTVEAWVYITSSSAANNAIYEGRYSASSTGFTIYYIPGTGLLMGYNAANQITGTTFTINTWNHVALVRFNGITKLYLNGSQTGSNYTDTNNYTSGVNSCFVGGFYDGSGSWNGYIDDFRITRGIARYTSNFTPPTTAFLTL